MATIHCGSGQIHDEHGECPGTSAEDYYQNDVQ
jgi:hypothetical protein